MFSRQAFLTYAFQQIKSRPDSFYDFWLYNDYDRKYSLGTISTHEKGFNLQRWLKQYKLFFKYLSKYIIPVYEWCFINMLMESIEQSMPKETHRQHLLKALDLLEKYMNKNYKTIIRPISSEGDVLDHINHSLYLFFKDISKDKIKMIIQNKKNLLDIITEHKNLIWLDDLSEESVKQIILSSQ